MYPIICETDRQARFNAWDRVLRTGALRWPWGIGWNGEGGDGEVQDGEFMSWLIHVNMWKKPIQYCKAISLQLNFFFKKVHSLFSPFLLFTYLFLFDFTILYWFCHTLTWIHQNVFPHLFITSRELLEMMWINLGRERKKREPFSPFSFVVF